MGRNFGFCDVVLSYTTIQNLQELCSDSILLLRETSIVLCEAILKS